MLNKNLALIVLVVFAAGCGLETKTYVMTKDRVGLDQTAGNGGCIMGKCLRRQLRQKRPVRSMCWK